MSRAKRLIGLTAVILLATGCVPGSDLPDIKPGERPPLNTDEAGLWMAMDKAEDSLKTSGRIVEDAELNAYLNDIVCRLAQEHCGDIRVYIVRAPNFNATMAPNGSMNVWTGMLLRARNEAQLAFVLGHEIAHYLRRHSLQHWQTIRNTTDFLTFFQIAVALAGVPLAGETAQLIALGSLSGYSRDHEREADAYGLKLMTGAGYDPAEAAKIWIALKAEKDADDQNAPTFFFATHPDTKERAENMQKAAAEIGAGRPRESGDDRYRIQMDSYRADWLRDEIRQKRFKRFRVILEQQNQIAGDIALIDFFRGEMHRLRAEDGDADLALAAYEKAVMAPGAPVEAYRSLGLMRWDRKDHRGARQAFASYLKARPDAGDRRMIASYITQLDEMKP